MKRPRLNRKLTLEGPVRVDDGSGGFSENWVTLGVLWADVSARSGREAASGALPVARLGYRIVVRAAPSGSPERPLPGQRFLESGRIFSIQAVLEHGTSGHYLNCLAQEEVVT